MAPTIFLTGGTGYIGGSILDAIVRQHPEYEVTVLLRNVPEKFSKLYPQVRIVKGTFDDTELLSDTAAQNDIVIHNGKSKHNPGIRAHIAGLLRVATPSSPRFFIRLGGTGIIADWADPTYYGETNPKIWSDVSDLDTITTLPDTALHRSTEKIVQEAAAQHGDRLKCAIVCSCGVYGPGRGPGNTQSLMVPEFYQDIMQSDHKRAFYIKSGGNTRSWVHIDDLASLYVRLVEAAAAGGGEADWGREGYYFTATQEHSWLAFATAVGSILKKHHLIENEEPLQLSVEDITKLTHGSSWPYEGVYSFACNTRTKSERARKVLGYQPSAPGLFECLEHDILAAAGLSA